MTLARTFAEKIVPSAAIPVAVPTWRSVELIPDAMPERAGSTTPTAVEASGTLTRPMPTPATTRPGMRCVHDEVGASPVISTTPTPAITKPGAMSHFTGTCAVSRPATAAVTKVAPVISKKRIPVATADRPSASWR